MSNIQNGNIPNQQQPPSFVPTQPTQPTQPPIVPSNVPILEPVQKMPVKNLKSVPRAYTTIEVVFSWICVIMGYLFCRSFAGGFNPMGAFITVLLLFSVTAVALKINGTKFKAVPFIAAVSALAVSSGLILSSNGTVHFWSFTYCIVAYGYFVYASNGNALEKGLSDFLPMDFLKSAIIVPFASIGSLFKALFHGKAQGGGKLIIKIVIGAAFAFVPTVIVVALLSYDAAFSELLSGIFTFTLSNVISHLISIGYGLLIGIYFFGLFISSKDKKCANIMTAESCRKAYKAVKIMPKITAVAATVPPAVIYVIFFFSQIKYYIAGFKGELPEGVSYAAFARDGFFELCTVSFINLLIILAVSVFVKRSENGKNPIGKVISIVYSVFTLILISTAIAKMAMYIDCYGLTRKRVYATWFMILLVLVFLIIIIKQFFAKFKAVAVSVGVCVVLFCALSFSDVDGFIAKYNVDRYLDGTVDCIDIDELERLGDSGIPEMGRLAEKLDVILDTDIKEVVNRKKIPKVSTENNKWYTYYTLAKALKKSAATFENEHEGIFSYTVPAIRAESALDRVFGEK